MLMLQNTEELPEGDAICACSSSRTYGRRYRRTAALASSGPFIVQMDWRWYRTGPVMAWHWVRKDHCLVCLEVESGVAQGSCSARPCRSRTSKIANRRPRLPSAAQRSAKLPRLAIRIGKVEQIFFLAGQVLQDSHVTIFLHSTD
jgi:hypothetical protein